MPDDDHSVLMVLKNNSEITLKEIEKLNSRLEKNTDEIHSRINKMDDRLKCVEFIKKSYESENVPERLDNLENSTSYYQGAIKILSALFGFVCLVIGWIISVVK